MYLSRRQFIVSLGALCLAPLLPACTASRPLTVGIHPWIGYETLFLAREFKWLPATVQLQETKALSDTAVAMLEGKLDAACLTLDEVLRVRAAGIPLCVALVFDVSAGADLVLARPAIRSLAALAGRRIGLEQNALGFLMLGKLLESAGLPLAAIIPVDCPPERQLSAWQNNEVDAIITYEPVATLLQRQGAKRLFDSRQLPDTIFDVLVVRNDRTKGRSTPLKALVKGHFLGLTHLQTNRQDAIYRIAVRENISPAEVQQVLAGVTLPSLAANREYLATHDGRLLKPAKELSAIMVRQGLLQREDSLDELITSAWLPVN